MLFHLLTEADISFIIDQRNTNRQIAEKHNVGLATASRWRKKLCGGIKSGLKKGTPKQRKRVTKTCSNCNHHYEVVPSRASNTIYCSRKCMYASANYIQKLKTTDKSYMHTEAYRKTKRNPNTPQYTRYKNIVHRLSAKTYDLYKEEINPNNYMRTISGVRGGYQLDHITTIRFGFDNNIEPEQLAKKENLRMLPWKENLARNRK